MKDQGHYIASPAAPGDYVVGAGEKLDLFYFVHPGEDRDIRVRVHLTGPGASVSLAGVYLSGGSEKVSIHTEIYHEAQGCTSDQLFNGIASGSAAVSFYGRIVVAPGADRTEAYQVNHNIVLSDKAKVDTKPQLEIYADDVKCSHGATVGSLNADEEFYMRSRGIPQKEAKVLQMISFVAPVLERIADPGERERTAAEVEEAIRKML